MIFLFILYSLSIHGNVLAGPLQQPLPSTFEDLFCPREILSDRNGFGAHLTGSIFFTRLKIMRCMLIAPKLMMVWVARQSCAAPDNAGRHKGVLFFFGINRIPRLIR